MNRRAFLRGAGALAASPLLAPLPASAQQRAARFADMHAHLGSRQGLSFREAMARGGMLIVAEKVISDMPIVRLVGNRLASVREAQPGELRRHFEDGMERRRQRIREEGLVEVASTESLDRVLREHTPAVVLSAEGADFLEGDPAYLDRARAEGLVHLQLVHYYAQSGIGDISTEEPRHGGLSEFGGNLVRACNRLGILVDVAHCSNAAMVQALEISSKPIVYSHGHISARLPHPLQAGSVARAIHAPIARLMAAKGGVVGLWPNRLVFADMNLYADEVARMVDALGAAHVGIGSDLFGLVRTIMPGYEEFAALEDELARRKLKDEEIGSVLGGNYVRVLRQALAA